MPSRTPRMDASTPPEGAAFVADVLAANVRAYRRLRDDDQELVARRMSHLGHRWVRATVSEVERGRRNVTVPEMVSLCLVLATTVNALLDPRGPERRGGPMLALANPAPAGPGEDVTPLPPDQVIAPDRVNALVCAHKTLAAVKWVGPLLRNVYFRTDRPELGDLEPPEVEGWS